MRREPGYIYTLPDEGFHTWMVDKKILNAWPERVDIDSYEQSSDDSSEEDDEDDDDDGDRDMDVDELESSPPPEAGPSGHRMGGAQLTRLSSSSAQNKRGRTALDLSSSFGAHLGDDAGQSARAAKAQKTTDGGIGHAGAREQATVGMSEQTEATLRSGDVARPAPSTAAPAPVPIKDPYEPEDDSGEDWDWLNVETAEQKREREEAEERERQRAQRELRLIVDRQQPASRPTEEPQRPEHVPMAGVVQESLGTHQVVTAMGGGGGGGPVGDGAGVGEEDAPSSESSTDVWLRENAAEA